MDVGSILMAIMLIKFLPGSVSAEAVAAAAAAAASAEEAASHNYGISIETGTNYMIITDPVTD